jgi:predicted nucleic acid-binding protein
MPDSPNDSLRDKKQFTIDEWLFHYLADENKIKEMIEFLDKMLKKCDRFVFKESTPLADKLYLLQRQRGFATPKINKAIEYFNRAIFWNSIKKETISNVSDLSEQDKSLLPRKDIYLVKMALATSSKIIISTDIKLIEALEKNKAIFGISGFIAESFISNYLETD